jgi:hypothetical protein
VTDLSLGKIVSQFRNHLDSVPVQMDSMQARRPAFGPLGLPAMEIIPWFEENCGPCSIIPLGFGGKYTAFL